MVQGIAKTLEPVQRSALMESREVVGMWMSLVSEFTPCFTRPSQRRFAALLTGALLSECRPLVTEIVTALGLEKQWRALEAFVEYGAWPADQIERTLCEIAARTAPPGEHGRQLWAVDDLKVLKSGKKIWGACSFHEYTSRSSNRPETVWAHNWVVCGALEVASHSSFLPTAGRLYIRESQLPSGQSFRTKPQLAVEVLRQCAKAAEGPHLAIFDGGYAVSSVVEPLIKPAPGEARIDFLTRLRLDSRLYEAAQPRKKGQRGRTRIWGKRLARPQDADQWPGRWQHGEAKVYGKTRPIRYKQVHCQWHPAGAEARVHAFAFDIEGYNKPWYLVTSDLGLSAEQVVELYAARFVQEDAHRDLKQHLGLGSCQGRLKNVVLRTFQLRVGAMTLMRLVAKRLDTHSHQRWWPKPPWYPQKQRGSLRDVKRLIVGARKHFSQLDWRNPTSEKPAQTVRKGKMPQRRAA
jgi:hypothetical protein